VIYQVPLPQDRMWLPVNDVSAAGGVRRAAVALGVEAGLTEDQRARLALVATELATNLAKHAENGQVLLRLCRRVDQVGVELVAIDSGPGMADFNASARDGHSTVGTLGIGLGAIARSATEFDAYSRLDSGTVITATLWARPAGPPAWVAGLARPLTGETVCGDVWAAREVDGRRQLMVCDGLGHGPLAALAAQAATIAFRDAPAAGPERVLAHIHHRVTHTRGCVGAVAEFDGDAAVVRYAGIGNIGASLVTDERRRSLVSLPGVLGQQQTRTFRQFDYPVNGARLLMMHSDGLTDRWDLATYPGLSTRTPLVVAATVLRDAARRRDDACLAVARLIP
jgi:anti-sigma regulatory factor (Ser/Thr protein kinase)